MRLDVNYTIFFNDSMLRAGEVLVYLFIKNKNKKEEEVCN